MVSTVTNTAANLPPDSNQNSPPKGYAKGLLKPFYKGKGGVLRLRDELMAESDAMNQEAINFEQQHNPFLLSIGLVIKRHGDRGRRTCYLRWRDRDQRKMGDELYEGALLRRDLTESIRETLFTIERERCLFNGRAGMINQELRNVRTIIERIDRAEALFHRETE